MHNRILDFSEEAAHLSVRNANLVIRRPEQAEITMPLDDVAVVVASHPAITLTHAVLAGLSSAGAAFIACDETRLPAGMMLPLAGHFVQTERIARQLAAKRPTCKRMWQQVVRAKLESQAAVLKLETGEDAGLRKMAERVRSGDPDNIEAQGARKYWLNLFGDSGFTRDRDAEDINAVLNYGYAVVRAITARAVCASGLHPSVGIHHHNRYSQFTLADDLMEPFRSVVDRAAVDIRRARGPGVMLDKTVKAQLFASLTARYLFDGEQRSLFDILARVSASLVQVLNDERAQLALPDFRTFFPDSRRAA